MKQVLYDLTLDQLIAWLAERGHKQFRALRVWEALYRARVSSFEEMEEAGVHSEVASLLASHFVIRTINVHTRQESEDGTVKFLFELRDGNLIETVLMRHKYGLSVCVTTQVGCNIGCSFCASGLIAKSRDLTSGEIVEQIIRVQMHLDHKGLGELVSHIVVMGIGEPFDNYDHVLSFLHTVMDRKGLAIAARRITVSTSGLVGKIREFADLQLPVNLAISLHAPNNELRTRIMKINRAYPLEQLMEALRYYLDTNNRRLTIEYILLKDVNDRPQDAEELGELLSGMKERLYVNLIPYNPVDEHSQYQRSAQASVLTFYDRLKKRGVNCKIRQEHGADIDAACGQLRSKQLQG